MPENVHYIIVREEDRKPFRGEIHHGTAVWWKSLQPLKDKADLCVLRRHALQDRLQVTEN